MRILFTTAAYPGRVDPGRVPALAALARALARRNEVEVLAPRVHGADPALEGAPPLVIRRFAIGSPGRVLKSFGPHPPLAMLARYAGAALLAHLRRAAHADVIYAHWALPTGILAALGAAPSGRPIVLHLHGSDVNDVARRNLVYERLARAAIRRARSVLAVSGDLARFAERAGAREASVLPLGIDTAVFRPRPRAAGAAAGNGRGEGKVALFVGDVTEAKGAALFVDAVTGLPPRWRGVVVGDGPLRAALERRAASRIRFAGRLDNDAIPGELAAADVFCLPSRSEGVPVAIMEALACGVPVVATDVGGIAALVRNDRTGIVVGPGASPASLGGAMVRAAALGPIEPPPGLGVESCAAAVERALERAAAGGGAP